MNTVTSEHITQTTQSTNRSEQNKEERVNKITTRMGKARATGSREHERVITDQLCYGCGSKEHKIQNCNKKSNIFVTKVKGTKSKKRK